jgi:hypothetical protein
MAAAVSAAIAALQMIGSGEDEEAVVVVEVFWIQRAWVRFGHGDSIVADVGADCEVRMEPQISGRKCQTE